MVSREARNILSSLQESLTDLTPRQRQAAEFILENNKKAAFLNSTSLARSAGVSESTVIRLAARMGYAGFPEFQSALQEIIQNELTALERLPAPEQSEGHESYIAGIFRSEAESIHASLNALSMTDVSKAVALLYAARRVYIAGAQASGAFAEYAAYSLGKVRPDVHLVRAESEEAANTVNTGCIQDAALVFALPRYPSRIVRLLRVFHKRKVPLILVTHSLSSPLAAGAEAVLAMRVRYHAFTDGLSPVICLVNALILGVYQRDEERGRTCLNRFEDYVAGAEVFDTSLKYTY